MNFTKRSMLLASAIVGLAIVVAQLSLKTMERTQAQRPAHYPAVHGPYMHIPHLEELSAQKIHLASIQDLLTTLETKNAGDDMQLFVGNALVKKLTSEDLLEEFWQKGTIDGVPLPLLKQIDSYGLVKHNLKKALAHLVSPYVISQKLTENPGGVRSPKFSPNGTKIAATSWDKIAHIWSLRPDGFYGNHQELRDNANKIDSVEFNTNNSKIITVSDDSITQIWSLLPNNTYGNPQILTGHTGRVNKAIFSPDESKIVIASDTTARIWTLQPDGSYGNPQILTGHTASVYSALFSPDGEKIITASRDSTVRVWTLQPDGSYGNPQILPGHAGALFSPDGTKIVTVLADSTAQIWSLQSEGSYGNPQTLTRVISANFSPDETKIVTVSSPDEVPRVWTLQSDNSYGNPQELPFVPISEVRSAVFSPDGTKIIMTSLDDVYVWSVKPDGSYYEHPRWLGGKNDAHFSPDGTKIISHCGPGTACIWLSIDLVGNTNVINKIMLLQLAYKKGRHQFKNMLYNIPYLQEIFATFSKDAQEYLNTAYKLDWTITTDNDQLKETKEKLHKLQLNTPTNPEDKIEKKKRNEEEQNESQSSEEESMESDSPTITPDVKAWGRI